MNKDRLLSQLELTPQEASFLNKGSVRKFIQGEDDISLAVSLIRRGVDKSEVFRQLSKHKGAGKPHCSGMKDGEMKWT